MNICFETKIYDTQNFVCLIPPYYNKLYVYNNIYNNKKQICLKKLHLHLKIFKFQIYIYIKNILFHKSGNIIKKYIYKLRFVQDLFSQERNKKRNQIDNTILP